MVRNKKKVNEEQWNGRNRDQAKNFEAIRLNGLRIGEGKL